ncbi:MAG: phosphate ABC transporter permease subunit PstC [Alphaproteobacteria bacterium]|jgi:phosphate transport system permease protein
MPVYLIAAIVLAFAAYAFHLGRGRVMSAATSGFHLNSLPRYYGVYAILACVVPASIVLVLWLILEPRIIESMVVASLPADMQALSEARLGLLLNDIRNLASDGISSGTPDAATLGAVAYYQHLKMIGDAAMFVVVLVVVSLGLLYARTRITPALKARERVERAIKIFLIASSTVAIMTTIGIVLSLLFESMRFFNTVSVTEFLFGLNWSPQTALRADQVGSSGAFGAIPLFAGTLLITLIAMCVAVPVGLMSAVYMADYASNHVRAIAKPILEILAGIPTVVYGLFAALVVAPHIRDMGQAIGLDVASESALAAGLVMGIMIIPFVSSLSDDVINAVPQSLRDGSYGMGATKSETIRKVVLPAALPGIVGAVLLAVSRAIGETMIVVMAAGLAANLTANPLEAVTTVTVQIVTLLVGDQEFDSAKTLSAFALGLTLFTITLSLNILALNVVRKYREKYD